MKNFLNKVARGVQTGADVASKYAPAVVGAFPELAPVAASVPFVRDIAGGVRGLTGGRVAGGRLAGGRVRKKRGRK